VHDVYNFIVADNLAFTVGAAGGFVLGWITGSLRRRRKVKPITVEAYDCYRLD
jgi:ABC-type uncharacterized transport system permease subunit